MNQIIDEHDKENKLLRDRRMEYAFVNMLAAVALFLVVFSIVKLRNGESNYVPVVVIAGIMLILVMLIVYLRLKTERSLEQQINVLIEYLDRTDEVQPEGGLNIETPEKRSVLRFGRKNDAAIDNINIHIEKLKKLHLLKRQAEYHAHQSQINPHFLYNTLDTIRGKAYETGQTEVAEMIEALSRIFRYSLSNKNDMQRIIDEIDNAKDYVSIQSVRFGNRFSFHCEVDESDWRLLQFKVPKLILQPLIENSLSHGLDRTVSGGKVILTIYRTASQVIIRVEDNGSGIPEERLKELIRLLNEDIGSGDEEPKIGIALRNINQRIKYIYGQDYGLSISSVEGNGTTTEIVMPFTED